MSGFLQISITGAGQQSSAIDVSGKFNLAIWGTFVGTIVLQVSYDKGSTWQKVEEYTAPATDLGEFAPREIVQLRIISDTFTSGTANCRISQ